MRNEVAKRESNLEAMAMEFGVKEIMKKNGIKRVWRMSI